MKKKTRLEGKAFSQNRGKGVFATLGKVKQRAKNEAKKAAQVKPVFGKRKPL